MAQSNNVVKTGQKACINIIVTLNGLFSNLQNKI
jgi:hypothetical protein